MYVQNSPFVCVCTGAVNTLTEAVRAADVAAPDWPGPGRGTTYVLRITPY